MSLQEQMTEQGNWLFRRRGLVPIVFVLPLAYGIATSHWRLPSSTLLEAWELFALAVSLCGLFVRVLTIGHTPEGTSGRNTQTQRAETLNTTGVYSTVRHPLYFANFLIGLGIVIRPLNPWLLAVYVLSYWLYYERIMLAEEAFLRDRFGKKFTTWAGRTPPFVPAFRLWKSPDLPFSIRTALKREYTALAMVGICHAAAETLQQTVADREFRVEPGWAVFLGATLATYFVLRHLKRHTRVLDVAGR